MVSSAFAEDSSPFILKVFPPEWQPATKMIVKQARIKAYNAFLFINKLKMSYSFLIDGANLMIFS
jgi:hypothetical protein